MWNNTRSGFNLIRKRDIDRKNKKIINICIAVLLVAVIILALTTNAVIDIIKEKEKDNNNKKNEQTGIYKEITSDVPIVSIPDINKDIDTEKKEDDIKNKKLKLTILGEMQFGGEIAKNTNEDYMLAVKEIKEHTEISDYVIATLGTNILRTDTVNKNISSKYIVSKQVINAFHAMNLNGINIATDHMLDFGQDVFKVTRGVLEEEEFDILGVEDSVIYVEKDGIKIAIIGVLNEVIGTEVDYQKAGIFMYNLDKLEKKIKDLKQKVNSVILMTHLGYENTHEITKIMSWFYKLLIDMGADAVVGSHSLGIYPVEIYNKKPIIYSAGYIISDTYLELGKQSAIFDFTFDYTGAIEKIEATPTYINNKKEVKMYNDINKEAAISFMQMISSNIVNKQIIDGKVIMNIK